MKYLKIGMITVLAGCSGIGFLWKLIHIGRITMEKSITAGELANLLASGKDITLLDVRRKEDFDKAPETIGGAQWKNPVDVDQWIQTLPEQRR